MEWTKETPSSEGVYWRRCARDGVECVEVMESYGGKLRFYSHGSDCPHDFYEMQEDTEWFGPIEPPAST